MNKYYLAVDIGASSGRHMLASVSDGKIELEEIYRFKNLLVEKNGHLCWDLDRLFNEIKTGIKKCSEIGKIPVSMGIDTWGVDFVLLDKDDKIIGDTVAYRDSRTEEMDKKVEEVISEKELYERTGIQKQPFNTIYQLMAIKEQTPENMEKAESMLFLPSYFKFLLTGIKKNEYTEASTSGLLDVEKKDWDRELIKKLGFKENLFDDIYMPKTVVGNFTPEIQKEVGFDCRVILPATHDTGSAVLSVPMVDGEGVYISSGTWSLMGIESLTPNCTEESREFNLTNEGGVEGRYRFLRNIMGLWIIQSIKRNLNDEYSFGDLADSARENEDFSSKINVNDMRFLAPENMIEAIKGYCRDTNQTEPQNVGQVMRCAYIGLAECYAESVKAIEDIVGKQYDSIRIVGGGCQDNYLNEMTAKATGKTVYAGPIEATALGNVLSQLMADGTVVSIEDAREMIRNSFPIKEIHG